MLILLLNQEMRITKGDEKDKENATEGNLELIKHQKRHKNNINSDTVESLIPTIIGYCSVIVGKKNDSIQ